MAELGQGRLALLKGEVIAGRDSWHALPQTQSTTSTRGCEVFLILLVAPYKLFRESGRDSLLRIARIVTLHPIQQQCPT